MNAQTITILRGALVLLAALFATNTIPTGVDGGGQKVAATCLAVAAMLAAGDQTPQLVRDLAVDLKTGVPIIEPGEHPAVQGFISTPGRDNNVLPNSQTAWISFAIKALIAVLTAALS